MESTPEYRASVAVWQYSPPLLFAFGTFGNLMTVVILRRMNMKRSAMPVFLAALALSDTCLLYTGLLRRWVMYVFHVDVRALDSAACKVHTWLVYSLIIVSAWLLSFMTLERVLSVWWPHRVSLLCTRSKAGVVVVAVVVGSLLVNAHLLYGVDLVVVQVGGEGEGGENGNATGGEVVVCSAPDEEYLYFFNAVWSWVDLTLASLIPFAALLIGNCLILWKVSLSVRAARYLGSVRPHNILQRQKTASSMTVTLVVLSVVFFITTSPICVYNIIEHYVQDDSDARGMGRLRLTWAVVNILMYTNSCVNFYLYCLSGTRFRKELKRCLCCCSVSSWSSSKHVDVHTITNNVNKGHNNGHHHDRRGSHRRQSDDLDHHGNHNHLNHHHHHHTQHYRRRCCGSFSCCLQRDVPMESMDRPDGVSLTFHSRSLRSVVDTSNDNSTEF